MRAYPENGFTSIRHMRTREELMDLIDGKVWVGDGKTKPITVFYTPAVEYWTENQKTWLLWLLLEEKVSLQEGRLVSGLRCEKEQGPVFLQEEDYPNPAKGSP